MKKGILILFALVMAMALAVSSTGTAVAQPTEDEIEEAIEKGMAWLAEQQNPDGSWGDWDQVGKTGFAVLKFETHAIDIGISPFDPAYLYAGNIQAGLNYLFANAHLMPIWMQPAGNPDTDGDGIGVYFVSGGPGGWNRTYETGIAMMAVAASTTPGAVVNVPGSMVNGWTYQAVVQDTVDYLAFGQTDLPTGRGGWDYAENNWMTWPGRSDNSNTGYAVLGLGYAEAAPPFGFSCTIPGFVKTELNIWIDYIQNDVGVGPISDDGGSGYDHPDSWVNILKTGNLLYEMAFVGDTAATPRVQDAVDYLVRHWYDADPDPGWRGWPWDVAHKQAMYTTMKGLEVLRIHEIDDIDWQADFAEVLLAQQNPDGSWAWDWWGDDILGTEWALLTLQKVVPPTPVGIDIKPGSYPNSINLRSKGVIPVAILTTSTAAGEPVDFDATTVDAETVRFGPGEATAVHYALEDVDGDGDIDMILHFKTRDTGIQPCDIEASLYGETVDGHKFIGTDSVRIVPPKAVKPPCLTVVNIQQPAQVAPCDLLTVAVEVHNQGCKPGECEVKLWVEDMMGNLLVGPVIAPTGVVDPCDTVTIPFGPWHVDESWVPGVIVVAQSCCGDPVSCPIEVVAPPVVPQPSSTWTYEVTYVDPICGYGPEVTQWTIHLVELSVAPIPDLLPECVLVPIPPGPASHVYIDTTQGGTMPPPQRFNVGCEPFTILGMDGYLSDVDGTNQYIYLNCASYLGVFQLEVEASYVNYILLSGTNVGQPYAVGNSWQYDQYLEVFTPIFLCAGFGSATVTVIVVAENQTVTVPAGTFTDCFEIQTLTATGIKTDWWSPTVQGVVTTVDQGATFPGNETWELLSYSLVY